MTMVIVLTVGVVAGLMVQIGGNGESEPSETPVRTPATILYSAHNPISISGNGEFTAANGVVSGSGIASDPYIIADWDINASTANGIWIHGTDAHFAVRDCYVHDGSYGSSTFCGIYLDYYCTNGTVENNTCSYNYNGIALDLSSNNTLINNNCSSNFHYGIRLDLSGNNTLINNDCSSNGGEGFYLSSSSNFNVVVSNRGFWNTFGCIDLTSSSNNMLVNNNCSSNGNDGIYLGESNNNTLINNTCSSTTGWGMYFYSSCNNTLSSNNCSSNRLDGIELDASSDFNVVVSNRGFWNGHSGIEVVSSSNNTLTNNTCSSNDDDGISLYSSSNNTLSDNNCSNNDDGIYLLSSSSNTLSNNTCSNNDYGMWLESSSSNTLTNNTCSSNYYDGILIYVSSNNNCLSDNTCSDSYAGIDLYSSHNNTLINNKCVNNEEGIFFEDSNSNNLTDNNCSFNNDIGIYLSTSNDNNCLSNNICSNNQYGIELVSSMGNKLCNNTCISNDETAIDLWYSDSNTLSDNNCSSSRNNGIFLVESSNNNITRNQLYYNGALGVWIMNGECSDNMIWNNTLVDNNGASSTYDPSHIQAYDDGTANWWNSTDAYGNYWSDWNSPDNDMDGIVDAPYEIAGSAGAKDWYPLTERPDIAEEPPVADAGPDQTVDEDTGVTLDGSESYDAIAVMNWTWTFTDSVLRTLYGEVVEWTFTHPGVYTVTLVVRDTIEQESAPDTCVIAVRDVTPPVANAGADVTLFMSVGTQITFNGSASSDNVDVVSYTWTFVDVIPRTLTGVTPTYTFAGPGVYTVTLTVADAAGNYATDTVIITVLDVNEPPTADAGVNQTVSVGVVVKLNGSSSTDDSGSIENYTWTFVYDNESRELYGVAPIFTFNIAGTYVVTLTVEDAEGETDTDTVIITVEEEEGEEQEEEKSFIESYGLAIGIVIALAVVALALFFILKGRKGGMAPTSMEEVPAGESEVHSSGFRS